jgi:hypothetical protein
MDWRRLAVAVLTIAMLAISGPAGAAIFSDDFNDGNVSDWTKTTNAVAGTANMTTSAAGHTSPYLHVDLTLDCCGGPTFSDQFVRASHAFTVPTAGDYMLDLIARSAPCSGCTISYDVLVDSNLLTRDSQVGTFESVSLLLPALTAGLHTLTLGMFTNLANNGTFLAEFDNVTISATAAIPEPSTYALLVIGLGLVGWTAGRRRKPDV